MYNRYIPQNGTYTRVVEQDGPEEGARRPAPHPPGPERGEPGQPGARPEEEAAGLPRVPWALAAWGTCSQGRRAR